MLTPDHSAPLVVVSALVAIMAAYTALRVTRGIEMLHVSRRRVVVARAACVLGGGIWAMHFIGMLAVELPEPLRFAALPTLLSALFAVLLVGIGFISLHLYWPQRVPGRHVPGERPLPLVVVAGTVMGLGIVGMHYIGMHAVVGSYRADHHPGGALVASVVAVAASSFGLWLAHRRLTLRDTLLGAVLLGLAVSAMHYSAMAFTHFVPVTDTGLAGDAGASPVDLAGETLAMIVAIAAFVICGLFLLIAAPSPDGEVDAEGAVDDEATAMPEAPAAPGPGERAPAHPLSRALGAAPVSGGQSIRVPYERQNTIRFVADTRVAAVRADGHYTWLITDEGELFCPWAISRFEAAMAPDTFVRTHRSYLARVDLVTGFRRDGDRALCLVGEDGSMEIPVSRNRIAQVREVLGVT